MLANLKRSIAAAAAHPIARSEPFGTLSRNAWWQIRRRLTGRPMSARTVGGGRMLVFPGRTSTTAAWYYRLPDFEDMLFMLHLLRPGDRFLDGGANLGVWSLLAAACGAEVTAVEPSPATYALLERQVAVSPFAGRIRPVRYALASLARSVCMTKGQVARNAVVADGGGVEVPARPLDDLTAGAEPTLVKLDLEGYELEALRGATRTLAGPRLAALVVETFRPHNWQTAHLRAIEALLTATGFTPFAYRPADRTLVPLSGLDAPPPADAGQNTIYVRNPAGVGERLRETAPVRVGRRAW